MLALGSKTASYLRLLLRWLLGGLLLGGSVWAQDKPHFALVDSASGQALPLLALEASVRVVGDRAVTTFDLTYASASPRGTRHFRIHLPEGIRIVRLAREVDGQLHEAGIAAYGPLPPAATAPPIRPEPFAAPNQSPQDTLTAAIPVHSPQPSQRIIIAWESRLRYLEGDDLYTCPLHFTDTVPQFRFLARAEQPPYIPVMRKHPLGTAHFQRQGNAYLAELSARNYRPDTPIKLLFPVNPTIPQVFFERQGDSTFFYLRTFPSARVQPKPPPKRILLLWDASFSALLRNLPAELDLLEAYLARCPKVTVEVVAFDRQVRARRTFIIRGGVTQALRNFLENLPADGATHLSAVNLSKSRSDEVLLFTDGASNCGSFSRKMLPPAPLYTFLSSPRSKPEALREACRRSGGALFDLRLTPLRTILQKLSRQNFRFIGVRHKRGRIRATFPRFPTPIADGFSLSGVFPGKNSKLELHFGYGDRVTEKVKVELNRPEMARSTPGLRRIWAEKQLAELAWGPDRNRAQIQQLAQNEGILVPGTAFIIPETAADYLKYRIRPPEAKLARYGKQLRRAEKIRQDSLTVQRTLARERHEDLFYDFLDRIEWHQRGRDSTQITAWNEAQRNAFRNRIDTMPRLSDPRPKAKGPRQKWEQFSGLIGQVLDANDLRPIPEVEIHLPAPAQRVSSDEYGYFGLAADSLPDSTQIAVTGAGYFPAEGTLGMLRRTRRIGLEPVPERPDPDVADAQLSPHLTQLPALLPPDRSEIAFPLADGAIAAWPEGILRLWNGRASETVPQIAPGEYTETHWLRSDRLLFRFGLGALRGACAVFTEAAPPEIRARQLAELTQLPVWDDTQPFRDTLRKTRSMDRYPLYLRLRDVHGGAPSFFVEVGTYFIATGREEEGLRILSNLLEFDLESPELLFTLAFQLQILGREAEALPVLERAYREFPELPQTGRELARAWARQGREAEAAVRMQELLRRDWSEVADLYGGFEATVLAELNDLLGRIGRGAGVDSLARAFYCPLPVPVRITAQWNRLDTDVDLWLVTPAGDTLDLRTPTEFSYPGADLVDGLGPEEVVLKAVDPGEYVLLADCYDDARRNEIGPTLVKIELHRNFGEGRGTVRTFGVRFYGGEARREVLRFRGE